MKQSNNDKMDMLTHRERQSMKGEGELTDVQLERLIREVEEAGLLQAPVRLKENVMRESGTLAVRTEKAVRKHTARMQLFFYSLKVSAAAAGAITLLMVVSLRMNVAEDTPPPVPRNNISIAQKLNMHSDMISGRLNSFSQRILDLTEEGMEINYD